MTLAATRIHTPCSERPGQSTRNRVDSHSSGMMICIRYWNTMVQGHRRDFASHGTCTYCATCVLRFRRPRCRQRGRGRLRGGDDPLRLRGRRCALRLVRRQARRDRRRTAARRVGSVHGGRSLPAVPRRLRGGVAPRRAAAAAEGATAGTARTAAAIPARCAARS